MPVAHHQVRISASLEQVFDFLLDGTNNPSWQPRTTDTAPATGPVGVGATFSQSMRHPLGFKVPAGYEVIIATRATELAMRSNAGGPIRPTQRYALTDNGDHTTTVTCTIAYRPSGILRIALPTLALLHPLFAWEASWIEHLPDAITAQQKATG